jgi:hypothetical protein
VKKSTGELVAIKILDIASANSDDIEAIRQEIKILQELKYDDPLFIHLFFNNKQ